MTPFLADEQFPQPAILLLRNAGIEVVAVREESPGIADPAVLELARQRRCVLLTLDKGFGRLIFHDRHPSPPGVVFFRNEVLSIRERPASDLLRLLADDGSAILGFYVTIQRNLVRRRPLPR